MTGLSDAGYTGRHQDCDVQWPPFQLATPSTGHHSNSLCNRRCKIHTENSHFCGTAAATQVSSATRYSHKQATHHAELAGLSLLLCKSPHWMLPRCVLNAPELWSLLDLITVAKRAIIWLLPALLLEFTTLQVQLTEESLTSSPPLRFIAWWITVNYKLITVKSPSTAAAKSHRDNESASLVSLPLFRIC